MENASKALLMAGSVLLAMLVIALLLFAWNSISDYQSSKEQLENIENVTEFNLQFANYDREDVYGYDIISLVNKVADYNTRYSSAEGNLNNSGYNPIEIQIQLGKNSNEIKQYFSYSDSDTDAPYLFKNGIITQNQVKSQITELIEKAQITETALGGQTTASKIAKNINSLDIKRLKLNNKYSGYTDAQLKKIILQNYNKTAGTNYTDYGEIEDFVTDQVKAYYEYYQFKKAIFKCAKIKFDDTTGRVSRMFFEFTYKIE